MAISNYLEQDYTIVMTELVSLSLKIGMPILHGKHGVYDIVWKTYLFNRGFKCKAVPRRNQAKLDGLISLHSAGAQRGHMAIVRDGKVFDALEPNGLALELYRTKYKAKHIRGYWSK